MKRTLTVMVTAVALVLTSVATVTAVTTPAGATTPTGFTITVDGGASTSISASANATLATSGLPSGATGTVAFDQGGSALCTATITAGDGSCATSGLSAGSYSTITATYSGDSSYDGSSSTNSVDLVVTTDTAFTITVNGASSDSISASANATLATSGLPSDATGTVAFDQGGSALCTATLTAGDGSCATSGLSAGSYSTITATYSGDSAYTGSTSTNSVDLVVTTDTAFTITVNGGGSATISASTDATLAASGLNVRATGTVEFDQAGSALCTATLPTTSCATSGLTAGSYAGITAIYSGDSDYTGSTSTNSVTLTVVGGGTSLVCTKVSGYVTKKITFTNCGLNLKGGRILGSLYLTGGTVTWATSKTGLTYSSSVVSPGQGSCGAGHVEKDVTGLVTATDDTFVSVGDDVSFRVCENSVTGVVKLVHGTTASF